jgi:site-specific DNA recombinase
MTSIQAAVYARVSSEQQANDHTIDSQLSALRERALCDGIVIQSELELIDDGYSGATLVRPALERLRDLVATGTVDQVYIHPPDRLARKYAYQVVLIDEFQRHGVQVIFLNREIGRSAEDDLLLQVQGMVAEYERAKITERSRRGKKHAAQHGSINVLSGAPYGYRFISKHEGGGQARYEIIPEQARVVRQIYKWIGQDRLSIGEVRRRLNLAKEVTRTGKTTWDRAAIWGMLKNPAYIGRAAFGKTQTGSMRPRLKEQRGGSLQPRRAYSTYDIPREEWIIIPVPPIVEEELYEAVQEQLKENQKIARQSARGARYLLQGIISCKECGYAYYGKPISNKAAKGKKREYAYYRCIGRDAYRFGGERVCSNTQVRTDLLDKAVWSEVRKLLEEPTRLEEEYQRRLKPEQTDRSKSIAELDKQLNKMKQGVARLIDSYAEGLIEKGEFEPRVRRIRERIEKLEEQAKELRDEEGMQAELKLIIGRLEEFAKKVKEGLDQLDWNSTREIIRALVRRIEVDKERVNVVYRISERPFESSPEKGSLQHCRRGNQPRTFQYSTGQVGQVC